MSLEPRAEGLPEETAWLEHSAFPTDLPLFEVMGRFWGELKNVLPADELHVVDPYLLDAGGADPATYAGNVVGLLKVGLTSVRRVVFVHAKERDGIRDLIGEDALLVNPDLSVRFVKGTGMHARYLIADRRRVLRMEFSFNRIGKHFGTISQVNDPQDLSGILDELQRLHPFG